MQYVDFMQSVDLTLPLQFPEDYPLETGDKLELQIRPHIDADPLAALTEVGGLVIDAANKRVVLTLEGSVTRQWPLGPGEYAILYGTLLHQDSDGNDRPASGAVIGFRVRRSYTRG